MRLSWLTTRPRGAAGPGDGWEEIREGREEGRRASSAFISNNLLKSLPSRLLLAISHCRDGHILANGARSSSKQFKCEQVGGGARAPYDPVFKLSLCSSAVFFLIGICIKCNVISPTSMAYEEKVREYAYIELAPLGDEGHHLLDFLATVLEIEKLENSLYTSKLNTGNRKHVEIQTLTFCSSYTQVKGESSNSISISSKCFNYLIVMLLT